MPPLIPEELHNAVNMDGFLPHRCSQASPPLGLLYADCTDAGALNEENFFRFKKLTVELSRTLSS
ncbi:hypothetical protein [Solemya velesiana gill symbiont]|uniref:Uncharacterized protein n=1 Tax=Solemya velesiana gill symbiont TaxID=1918948 RepID=A0A1T2KTJ6_9GAMM|nr:hypothetical protein [Solemya velesiana gill symbiont]OOZ36121.1 hypothetical protein BOW51_08755 [Solemya velesiana gill symbiont]